MLEDGDTVTHASQRECKTYRGCQSSGVTDSDSERQHEINMAVQTVQGRGHTDCQEGGTETQALAQTQSHVPLQAQQEQRDCKHTENTHSLTSAHIQTLLCTGVHQNPSICPHTYWLLLTHPSPSHIQADVHSVIPRFQHPPAGHR